MHDAITSSLQEASREFSTIHDNYSPHQVPGWNEYCREAHEQAREAFLMWQSNNKPRQGYIFNLMKTTRASFKYALRFCRSVENRSKADALAKEFLLKDPKVFWKHVKKLNNNGSNVLASTVAGVTGEEEISQMWQRHYQSLLNSNNDTTHEQYVMSELYKLNGNDDVIKLDHLQVKLAISKLKYGKAGDLDGLSGEHYKFADVRINYLLSLLFNSMFSHSYLPNSLMQTVIVPIIKDKRGDVTDKDNYRPIALTCILSKIMEFVILEICDGHLSTSDHQFGFKTKHSTDQCVFVLKQIIEYYNCLSSPVYVCYLDASKAFDRINHWCLFKKLLQREMPKTVIRLLVYWYTSQQFAIRWGSIVSDFFMVSNGVRQGGILSPALFNLYMDDLSNQLVASNIGCNLNGVVLNHFLYADDSVICAPSPSALQKLLNVCESFANDNGIIYNVKKTKLMCFKPRSMKKLHVPSFFLCGKVISVVYKEKYLGLFLTDDLQDDQDLMRQLRSIYCYGNMLIKKFKCCSDDVKTQLFKTFCCNFYGSQLWCNHKASTYTKVKVAFNNVYRKLMSIKRGCSMSMIYVQNNVNPFAVLLRKSVFNFRKRVLESTNSLVKTVVQSVYFLSSALFFTYIHLIIIITMDYM